VRAILLPLFASAFIVGVAQTAAIRAENANGGTLRVCLDENLPPYSVRRSDRASGFDFLVAQDLAKRLGRTIAVQWFESKIDADSSPKIEANALLSDGRCALLGGYPLSKDLLGKPGVEDGRLPDFAGARPADRRRRVTLGTLIPTTPSHFAGLTVVLGEKVKNRQIRKLTDLDGMNLTVESGALGDVILMTFDNGRFVSRIAHVVPGRNQLFPKLESGEADATIIPMHRFDAYRIEHPDTRLTPSNFYLSIGFNMGFVGLASESQLLQQASAAIDDMLKSGEVAALAQVADMTYLPPRQPYILDHLTVSDLSK
jgi:ABC-type amino acid transport substrate-binding protein